MVKGRENRGALCPFARMVTGDTMTAVVTHAWRVGSRLDELSLSRFMVHEASEERRSQRRLVDRALACSPARPRSWLSSV